MTRASDTVCGVPMDGERRRAIAREAAAERKHLGRRDQLIVEAVEAGDPIREIATAAGITHPSVLRIVKRHGRAK